MTSDCPRKPQVSNPYTFQEKIEACLAWEPVIEDLLNEAAFLTEREKHRKLTVLTEKPQNPEDDANVY